MVPFLTDVQGLGINNRQHAAKGFTEDAIMDTPEVDVIMHASLPNREFQGSVSKLVDSSLNETDIMACLELQDDDLNE